MCSGIVAQYGFLYQRMCFIKTILERAGTGVLFTYEGKDDIDVSKEKFISMIRVSNEKLIQVKSGTVNLESFCKIIGNWLLAYDENITYMVILENDISFDFDFEKFINWVKKGKEKSKKSIANKVYSLYESDKERVEQKVKEIIKNYEIDVLQLDYIEKCIIEQFSRDYCNDILKYDKAKEKRCEMIISLLNKEIDDQLKCKKPCVISYSRLMNFVGTVKESINDDYYEINITEIKKALQKDAKEIVEKSKTREVNQLKSVNNSDKFVITEIINELMYKDFRDVYIEHKNLQISNIEQIAKSNYDDALYYFSSNPTPKEIFNKTVNSDIDNSLLPKGSMYKRGCYTYLTSEEIDKELQISWSINNE